MSARPGVRLVAGLVLLAMVLVGDDLYGWATASGRVADGLGAGDGRVHVVVQLPFEPERYHLEELGQYGSYAGRGEGENEVRLIRVTQSDLTALSHLFWVERIEPLQIDDLSSE